MFSVHNPNPLQMHRADLSILWLSIEPRNVRFGPHLSRSDKLREGASPAFPLFKTVPLSVANYCNW